MPQIEVQGFGTLEVPAGTRLVRALEDNGVDILHRCGGNARCTTCRVEITAGAPQRMTVAEKSRLGEKGLLGAVRLSCQIAVEGDMALRPVYLLHEMDLPDSGPQPAAHITPEPEWTEAP